MTGSVLWAKAGSELRGLLIRLACDGDLQRIGAANNVQQRLTVAQALEVLK